MHIFVTILVVKFYLLEIESIHQIALINSFVYVKGRRKSKEKSFFQRRGCKKS